MMYARLVAEANNGITSLCLYNTGLIFAGSLSEAEDWFTQYEWMGWWNS